MFSHRSPRRRRGSGFSSLSNFLRSGWSHADVDRAFAFKRGYRRRLAIEALEDRRLLVVSILNGGGLGYAGNFDGSDPPDTCGAAGPSSYIEAINGTITIFTKATGATLQTHGINDFFYNPAIGNESLISAGSCGTCDSTIIFDNLMGGNGRFIIGDIDIEGDATTNASQYIFAVSKSNNPATLTTADWNFYHLTTTEGAGGTATWSDYPGNPGYNADAVVVTFNMAQFNVGAGKSLLTGNAQIVSINAADLANGVSQASLRFFRNDITGSNNYRPTTMHDSVAGDPMWLIHNPDDGSNIQVVKMGNVLSNAATGLTTPTTLPIPAPDHYTPLAISPKNPDGTELLGDDDVVGNSNSSSSIDDRIMKAAEFNNIIVTTHIAQVSGTEIDAQWYAIDVSTGTPAFQLLGGIANVGRVGFGANSYNYYPGIDINSAGQIGLSFIESDTVGGAANSATKGFPSTFVAARTAAELAGTMEASVLVPNGTGTGNITDRAGDFSGMNIDPVNGTFWADNQFGAGGNPHNDIVNFAPIAFPPGITLQNGVLTVCGDELATNFNDTFKIERETADPTLLDVFVNSAAPTFTIPIAAVSKLAIYGGGGNNTLIVDSTNGLINVPQGIDWNAADPCPDNPIAGEDGFNQTILQQAAGASAPTLISDVYTVGPTTPGNGMSVVTDDNLNVQTVNFYEVSPTFDSLPALTLTVTATSANSAIAYSIGKNSFANFFAPSPITDATWGEVSVDEQEPIEFQNKVQVIVNAGSGDDTVVADNANVPTGLQSIAFEGEAGNDEIRIELLAATGAGGTFVGASADGGDGNDELDASLSASTTPLFLFGGAGNDTITGGAGTDLIVGGTGNDIIVASAGNDTINGGTGNDQFKIIGTLLADTITANQSAANTLAVSVTTNGVTSTRTYNVTGTPNTDGIEQVYIDGGFGDDTVAINVVDSVSRANSFPFYVVGNAPNASDRLIVNDDGIGDLVIQRQRGGAADRS